MTKRITILLVLAVSTMSLYGQNILNSPYSRIGFGDIEDDTYMHLRNMGSLGSSWTGTYLANYANPASLTYLRSTSFNVGIEASNVELDDGSKKSNQWGGKFDYLGIAFPLHNTINDLYENKKRDLRFGMGFDLSKRYSVGYNITSIDSTQGLGMFTRNYEGNGGNYELSWSNAVQYKSFSFGLKLGYLFGSSNYIRRVTFDDKDFPFNDNFEDTYFVKAFTWNTGIMYSKLLGDPEQKSIDRIGKLTIGIRANSGSNFTSIADQIAIGEQRLGGGAIIRDTIYNRIDNRGKGFLPGTYGIGANYSIGKKFGIGFDYKTRPWSQYYHELKGDVKNELRNDLFVSIGGFFRPDYKSYNNYFKRMSYRFGGYYVKDPRVINGEGVIQYGVRFGLDLPFVYQRKGSNANLGVDLGRKGQGTIIEEKYIKLNFGFTFNDEEWFLKRKYN